MMRTRANALESLSMIEAFRNLSFPLAFLLARTGSRNLLEFVRITLP